MSDSPAPERLSRRRFLGTTAATAASVSLLPWHAMAATPALRTPLEQAPLPYAFDALEPAIDRQTMEIHFGKHHAGYVRKLQGALDSWPEGKRFSAEGLVANLREAPEALRTTVRNNAGGHLNHTLFWSLLAPVGSVPFARRTPLGRAIREKWQSLDRFWEVFSAAGTGRFGSGWVWLCARADGSLLITSTPNQDNPLMDGAPGEGAFPVLGLDVWEHAYYLRYQNARGAYLAALKQCINWEVANQRFEARSFQPTL